MNRPLTILLATLVLYGAGTVPSTARAIGIPTDAEAFVGTADAKLFKLDPVPDLDMPLEPESLPVSEAVAVPQPNGLVSGQFAGQSAGQAAGGALGKPRAAPLLATSLARKGAPASNWPAPARRTTASGESRLLALMEVLGFEDLRGSALIGALRDIINPLSLLSGMPTVGFVQRGPCCDEKIDTARLLDFSVADDSNPLDFGDINISKLLDFATIDLSSLLDFGGTDLGRLLDFGGGSAPANLNSPGPIAGAPASASLSPFNSATAASRATVDGGTAGPAQDPRRPSRDVSSANARATDRAATRYCLCGEGSCEGAGGGGDTGGLITRVLRMIKRFASCLTAES